MSKKTVFVAVVTCLAALFLAQVAMAQNNPPPAGPILDLNGTPIPGGGNGSTYQQYMVNFTATLASTDVTFAFREDPAFLSFTDLSLTDLTSPSGNLFANPDFTGGVYTSNGNAFTPVGWTYANVFGASFGGVVLGTCSPAPSGNTFCWYDGAVQSYDAIDQFVSTTVGDTYQISFYLADNSGCYGGPPCNFRDVSNNGLPGTSGNGIDLTVYAQAGLPPPSTPEPATLLMFGTGVLGLLGVARRRIGL